MTFRITGPGSYVNRRGERVEIESVHPKSAHSITGLSYRLDGQMWSVDGDMRDIVGVWEEPQSAEWRLQRDTQEHNARKEQPVTYQLAKVSERFRALEEGRTLNYDGTLYTVDDIEKWAADIVIQEPWSLVPETKRVVTKLWVYKELRVDGKYHYTVFRKETPTNPSGECLGAIEGSEQTEEVEV